MIRYLHHQSDIDTKYVSAQFADHLDGLIVQRHQIKKLNHRDQTVIVSRHDNFLNLLVYCNERYAEVIECGAPSNYFDGAMIEPLAPDTTGEVVVEVFVDTFHEDNLLAVPVFNPNQDVREKITSLLSKDIKLMTIMYLLLKYSKKK